MIFDNNDKVDKGILLRFRYYGQCSDNNNQIWHFYTNSKCQFNNFANNKEMMGMQFINGKKNKGYKVVRRML